MLTKLHKTISDVDGPPVYLLIIGGETLESFETIKQIFPQLKLKTGSRATLILDVFSIPEGLKPLSLDGNYFKAYQELYLLQATLKDSSTESTSDLPSWTGPIESVFRIDLESVEKEVAGGCYSTSLSLLYLQNINVDKQNTTSRVIDGDFPEGANESEENHPPLGKRLPLDSEGYLYSSEPNDGLVSGGVFDEEELSRPKKQNLSRGYDIPSPSLSKRSEEWASIGCLDDEEGYQLERRSSLSKPQLERDPHPTVQQSKDNAYTSPFLKSSTKVHELGKVDRERIDSLEAGSVTSRGASRDSVTSLACNLGD